MRFGSVCSGIEAASVAWASLGWKAAWFSEIEPFPCEVLKHHFPDVTNMGDMTLLPERIASGEVEPPDMLCGGTPCQAFSYAGKRRSLDDYRGNLSLTFCDIADSIDEVRTICGDEPCIVFWENVPGVLSTKDNAFGCFLGQLVGADAPLSSGSTRWPCAGVVVGPKRKAAWRVLDAQHFGVPQRRRRVFVVASARERVDPVEILFERKGVCGDSEKGGSQRQAAAAFTLGSFAQYREGVGTLKAQGGDIGGGSETIVVEPSVYDMTHACDVIRESELSPTLQARMGTGGNQIPLVLSENGSNRMVCVGITPPLKTTTPCCCLAENTIGREPKNGGNGVGYQEGLSYTLNATGVHGVMQRSLVRRLTPVECERLQGFPSVITFKYEEMTRDEIIAIALANKDLIVDAQMGKVYRTRGPGGKRLEEAREIKGTQANGYLVATLHGENCRKQVRLNRVVWISVNGIPPEGMVVDHINSIKTDNRISNLQLLTKEENSTKASNDGCYLSGDSHPKAKLTVELSEKLLNEYKTGIFSYRDLAKKYGISHSRVGQIIKEHGYTQIPYRGKPAEQCPDAPRYKAIGNSWAVPVVRWIGNRMKENLK